MRSRTCVYDEVNKIRRSGKLESYETTHGNLKEGQPYKYVFQPIEHDAHWDKEQHQIIHPIQGGAANPHNLIDHSSCVTLIVDDNYVKFSDKEGLGFKAVKLTVRI